MSEDGSRHEPASLGEEHRRRSSGRGGGGSRGGGGRGGGGPPSVSAANSSGSSTPSPSITLQDIVLDSRALSHELYANANDYHRLAGRNVWLSRLLFGFSLTSLALSARLYYVLYHAPFRQVWRMRSQSKVQRYRRWCIGCGVGGGCLLLFLVSPLGLLQRVSDLRRNAEACDDWAMKGIVLSDRAQQLQAAAKRMAPTRSLSAEELQWWCLPCVEVDSDDPCAEADTKDEKAKDSERSARRRGGDINELTQECEECWQKFQKVTAQWREK